MPSTRARGRHRLVDALIGERRPHASQSAICCSRGRLWLIDHGAAVYHQHAAGDLAAQARATFPAIGEHVLLPYAGPILEADERLAPRLPVEILEALAALIPQEWQEHPSEAYAAWLELRLTEPRAFAQEAEDARARQ